MTDVRLNSNHAEEGQALLPIQYQSKTKISGFLATFMDRIQEIESALYGVWAALQMASATGNALDQWGTLLASPRAGRTDTAYRAWLFTRIAVYKSRGRIKDVIAVARLALGDANLEVFDEPPGMNGFIVQKDSIDPDVVHETARAIGEARPAGVKGILVYSTSAPEHTLHFANVGPADQPGPGLAKAIKWSSAPYDPSPFDAKWAGAEECKP